MEIIRHTTGRASGSISVLNTIETMREGDTWVADLTEVKSSTVYSTCSEYGSMHGKQFRVSMKENEGKITITRLS